jgi:hypothetical protein
MPIDPDQYMAGNSPSLSRGGGWLPPSYAAVSPLQFGMQLTDFDTASAWRNGPEYPEFAVDQHRHLLSRRRSLSLGSHAHSYARSRVPVQSSRLDVLSAARDAAIAPQRPSLARRGFSQPDVRPQRTEPPSTLYRPQAKPLVIRTASHRLSSEVHSEGPATGRPTGYISPTEPTHWADSPGVPTPPRSSVSSQQASMSTKLPSLPYGRHRACPFYQPRHKP